MNRNESTCKRLIINTPNKAPIKSFSLLYLVLSLIILISVSACDRIKTPPPDLVGVWETDAPRYENRYIEITNESLIFGLYDSDNIVNEIKYIKLEKEGLLSNYTIHYVDPEGEKWTLTLSHDPHNNGTLKLQNRDEVWFKSET
jgi:hypothetical protein